MTEEKTGALCCQPAAMFLPPKEIGISMKEGRSHVFVKGGPLSHSSPRGRKGFSQSELPLIHLSSMLGAAVADRYGQGQYTLAKKNA